jgi:hypothetical protein
MANTANRSSYLSSIVTLTLAGLIVAPLGSLAFAQSSAAFATVPYLPNTVPLPDVQAPKAAPSKPAIVPTTPKYKGPAPIVMFRASTPPPVPVPQASAVNMEPSEAVPQLQSAPRPYSIVNQAQRDAASSTWNPANLDDVMAPPVVAGMTAPVAPTLPRYAPVSHSAQPHRPAIKRILQDTGRSLVYDVPEAVADALPWVDRDAKNEPFDQVLERVSEDLNRAAVADPAWALPAQREIRALSKRLEMLPAPPPLTQNSGDSRPVAIIAGLEDRPFRARPIWPGTSGRPEAQVRPITIITASGQQDGPRATGVAARYVPAAEDDSGAPPVASAPKRRAGAGRGTPARRATKSR